MRKCLNYKLENSILFIFRKDIHLVCIPESRVALVLNIIHDQGGHWAKEGTLVKLRKHAYWPAQSTDVEKYVAGCIFCARHAPAQRNEFLNPILPTLP